jgi:hypothetical protein
MLKVIQIRNARVSRQTQLEMCQLSTFVQQYSNYVLNTVQPRWTPFIFVRVVLNKSYGCLAENFSAAAVAIQDQQTDTIAYFHEIETH